MVPGLGLPSVMGQIVVRYVGRWGGLGGQLGSKVVRRRACSIWELLGAFRLHCLYMPHLLLSPDTSLPSSLPKITNVSPNMLSHSVSVSSMIPSCTDSLRFPACIRLLAPIVANDLISHSCTVHRARVVHCGLGGVLMPAEVVLVLVKAYRTLP